MRGAALPAASILALAAIAMLSARCVPVLGLEERKDAVEAICACGEIDFVRDCEETLTRRLDGATAETRAAWLARYEAECTKCPRAERCYRTEPTCSLAACEDPRECCAYDAATNPDACDPAGACREAGGGP